MKTFSISAAALAGVMLLILFGKIIDIHGIGALVSHDVIQNLLLLAIAARITTTKS